MANVNKERPRPRSSGNWHKKQLRFENRIRSSRQISNSILRRDAGSRSGTGKTTTTTAAASTTTTTTTSAKPNPDPDSNPDGRRGGDEFLRHGDLGLGRRQLHDGGRDGLEPAARRHPRDGDQGDPEVGACRSPSRRSRCRKSQDEVFAFPVAPLSVVAILGSANLSSL